MEIFLTIRVNPVNPRIGDRPGPDPGSGADSVNPVKKGFRIDETEFDHEGIRGRIRLGAE